MKKIFHAFGNAMIVLPFLVGFAPRTAHASVRWAPANVVTPWNSPGCAIAIAVGASNLPVVLGCGSGTNTAWYDNSSTLTCTSTSSSGTCLNYSNTWTPMTGNNTPLTHIAMTLNGLISASDNSGNMYFALGNTSPGLFGLLGGGETNGDWEEWQTTSTNGGACLQSFAVTYMQCLDHTNIVPGFPCPDVSPNTFLLPDLFGIGCGATEENIWYLGLALEDDGFGDFVGGLTSWSPVGPNNGHNNTGDQVALFTDVSGLPSGSITQNLWVKDEGGIYYFSPSTNSLSVATQVVNPQNELVLVNPQPPDENVTAITDHYVVSNGNVYYWNGNNDGTGTASWTYVIGPTPDLGINQIAWANAVPNTSSPGGFLEASQLWAIDGDGSIYVMIDE